jgi:RimJ/RimL family protein N-acetyltransferase
MTADDVDAVWVYRSEPEASEWLERLDSERDSIEQHLLHRDGDPQLVVEFDDDVIGDLMIAVQDGWSQAEVGDSAAGVEAELGWVFTPEQGGNGLATEAVEEVLRICFEDLGLRRVVADCFDGNEPSWRLMERVGMRREGHAVRESLHREHGWLDRYSYALLADDWRARPR